LLKPSQSAQAVQLPCIRHSLTPCRAQFCLIARLPPDSLGSIVSHQWPRSASPHR
jgi:hypothetical protein